MERLKQMYGQGSVDFGPVNSKWKGMLSFDKYLLIYT